MGEFFKNVWQMILDSNLLSVLGALAILLILSLLLGCAADYVFAFRHRPAKLANILYLRVWALRPFNGTGCDGAFPRSVCKNGGFAHRRP